MTTSARPGFARPGFDRPAEHVSRTDVDVATGILVGLRGCSVSVAHDELLGVAAEHRLSPFSVARALITAASGGTAAGVPAAVVDMRWGSLIGHTSEPR